MTASITHRKETEPDVQKLASIVQHGKELVNIASLDGKMIFLNQTGCAMLGIDPDDVTQFRILDIIPEHLHEVVLQELFPTLQKGGSWQGELQFRNIRTDGLIDVITTTFVIADPVTKAPQYIANVSLDISVHKRLQQEKEKLQEQLNQAQKMESIGRLAGGVAHDFNNMLGAILGYTEMALEKLTPDQSLYTDLQEVRKAALRSADLTRQLLAFARKQTIVPKVLDLNENVETTLTMLRRLIGEDIDLIWLPGKSLWPVKMDPSQIDQILVNLCINSRDSIKNTGKITIETKIAVFNEPTCVDHSGIIAGEYVLLTVSDTGCGMDKETVSRLFEPFFTTKELGRGTGLGLATVYGIVKQNKGLINVYSEPGMGTTFKIYLPRHEAEVVSQSRSETVKPIISLKNETVLLVEDESMLLTLTKKMLEQQGYKVLTAISPNQAIKLAQTYPGKVHLLLTDVVMPEMNGKNLADQITALCPDIKCLFMSGYTGNIIVHHGILDEGVHFIQKPFSPKELNEKIREALAQGIQ